MGNSVSKYEQIVFTAIKWPKHLFPPLLPNSSTDQETCGFSLFSRSLLGGGFNNDVIPSAILGSDPFSQGIYYLGKHSSTATCLDLNRKQSLLLSLCRFGASERDGSLSRQPVWPCTVWWSWSKLHNSIILTHFATWEETSPSTIHCQLMLKKNSLELQTELGASPLNKRQSD